MMKRVSLIVFICVSLFVFFMEIVDSKKREKVMVSPEVFNDVDSLTSETVNSFSLPNSQVIRRTTR